jgi:hypothetical protein
MDHIKFMNSSKLNVAKKKKTMLQIEWMRTAIFNQNVTHNNVKNSLTFTGLLWNYNRHISRFCKYLFLQNKWEQSELGDKGRIFEANFLKMKHAISDNT